jgi:hypothetical protein
MTAQTSLPGFGTAVGCTVTPARSHRPVPVRSVWHHLQPKEAGGETTALNLVSLCDNCHYTIHRIMWMLKASPVLPAGLNRAQVRLARIGYERCVTAGTVDKIPNEG